MVRNCASSKMEPTFYDESFNQRVSGDVNQLKRSMKLDLNQAPNIVKRPKYNAAVTGAPVLSSPDLNKLKLGSPELEKFFFAQQNGMMTTTPTPTQILFPRTVTEEQEIYAQGFVQALNELHTNESSQMSSGGLQAVDGAAPPSAAVTYTTLEPHGGSGAGAGAAGTGTSMAQVSFAGYGLLAAQGDPVVVKDEPQTVPSLGSTPPLSPINMECQEKIKLERKRQRNRIAASKCRRRKLERISRLEDKVKLLKGENSELGSVVHKLKEQVCQLKEQVMDHVHSGCQIMMSTQF